MDRRKGTQLEEKDDDNNNKLVYSFHREKEQVTEARFSIPFGRGARFLRQFLTGGRREFSTRRIINSSPPPPWNRLVSRSHVSPRRPGVRFY